MWLVRLANAGYAAAWARGLGSRLSVGPLDPTQARRTRRMLVPVRAARPRSARRSAIG